MSFCDRAGKQIYRSSHEAHLSPQKRKGYKKTRVYRCNFCDGFHLTSQPETKKGRRR